MDIEHCAENELCIACQCIPPDPICGNGIVEPGEACDDGNSSNTDACNNQCELTVCGDGITQNPNGQ
ncbi:MAG: DUF4215 domain-containing protein [Rhizobiaceae bacterium]|nr:DUF4215 domain-containing protein [Rhizobiaceae bacterium]